ncbi:EPIDERMAL PATTERNING FACTOR-like protein 5 [Setaria viridis]|uniref:Epidermal patterning factor-like protein n=1 Tax=Setaria viridis TaxID=4556 RepID=A0A4U6UF92_SETVI|nr:EPIDERMAL PATTERNING FACTOR-like protein 3 [Setaria viridis]TKW13962.1 hypothetical protein SEVIR_5G135400v2 [Setaria viridis]
MCGAHGLRKHNSRAPWFLFVFVLLLPIAVSQGDRELAHVGDGGQPSPIGGGEGEQEQLSRLGSRPPCCESKCGGCAPCEPVQVRAGAVTEGGLRPQCANYEPVGWKCRCGAAVFDP